MDVCRPGAASWRDDWAETDSFLYTFIVYWSSWPRIHWKLGSSLTGMKPIVIRFGNGIRLRRMRQRMFFFHEPLVVRSDVFHSKGEKRTTHWARQPLAVGCL